MRLRAKSISLGGSVSVVIAKNQEFRSVNVVVIH